MAARIDKVVYLEPYSKSMAIDLHDDSIADNKSERDASGKVQFLPYQGVSPRLFKTVYQKTGDLKDESGKILPHDAIVAASKPRASIWTKTFEEFEEAVVQFIEKEIEGTSKSAGGR